MRIDLLGEKTQVVGRFGMRHEHALRLVDPSRHRENLRQPEATEDERPVLPANAVASAIPVYVRALAQLGLDPLHGSKHTIIVWREKSVNWKQKQGRVTMLVIIGRNKVSASSIQTASTDLRVDLVGRLLPSRSQRLIAEQRRELCAATECKPTHQFRMHVVPLAGTWLPNAMIGLTPHQ